ncbi:MAG: hypothetical protein IJ390_12825 [Lachnospiraceae bacterium]|nr:hypothetical protein [Lachnospiraceae bacterium]
MKFNPLLTALSDVDFLENDYRDAREIGIVRLGESCLFFRKKLKIYYIPYENIERCFRRVMLVPAKMCCGKGDLAVENLVICSGEEEIAQIQIPGTKAAKILMDELKIKAPNADFTRPDKTNETTEE